MGPASWWVGVGVGAASWPACKAALPVCLGAARLACYYA